MDRGGRDRDHVGIQHHEGQAAIAFQRMLVVELQDRGDLGVGEPPVAGDFAIVLIDAAVTLLPVVELALAHPQPRNHPLDGNLRAFGPFGHVVHDRVARVVGNPNSV